ncbi:MAG: S1 RNA-binding domain-containing protein, partial [Fimbriimonas ginsengisoli]|nr:S1 RNA-binding domain-containing protein [Fimbriimonas ginsengisoli]
MMIDDTPTPMGESEAQKPATAVASDPSTMDIPSPDNPPADAPVVENHAAPEPLIEEPRAVVDDPEPVDEPGRLAVTDAEPAAAEPLQAASTGTGGDHEPAADPMPLDLAEPEPIRTPRKSERAPTAEGGDLFEEEMRRLENPEGVETREGSYKRLVRGERLEATVIQVDKDRLFVDLGTKSEGIVPLGELSE